MQPVDVNRQGAFLRSKIGTVFFGHLNFFGNLLIFVELFEHFFFHDDFLRLRSRSFNTALAAAAPDSSVG